MWWVPHTWSAYRWDRAAGTFRDTHPAIREFSPQEQWEYEIRVCTLLTLFCKLCSLNRSGWCSLELHMSSISAPLATQCTVLSIIKNGPELKSIPLCQFQHLCQPLSAR